MKKFETIAETIYREYLAYEMPYRCDTLRAFETCRAHYVANVMDVRPTLLALGTPTDGESKTADELDMAIGRMGNYLIERHGIESWF